MKNENNKEHFLTAGYKIKIVGGGIAPELGAAETPQQPEPQVQQPSQPPDQQQGPKPSVANKTPTLGR